MPRTELTKSLIEAINYKANFYDTVEKGLILRVTEKGTKSFCYRYKIGTKKRRYTFARYPSIGLAKARTKVKDFKNLVLNGIDPQQQKDDRKEAKTFRYLAEQFINKYASSLRESTQKKYRRIVKNELVPVFGDYLLTEISKKKVINYLDRKAFDNDSPTHANNIRARLHTMLNFAIQRDLIDKNVVKQIPKYKNGMNRRERFYSEPEIKELWNYFNQLHQPTGSIFKILMLTGQRKTETMKMKFVDVDFKRKVWTIPSSIAKNHQAHEVPLSSKALEIINDLKKGYSKDSDYVFSTNSKRVDRDQAIQKIDATTRKVKKETSVKDFRPHDIRRTVATYLAKLGTDRTVLGKILNHKGLSGDTAVTAIYDRHSYLGEKREALENWGNHLEKIMKG